MTCALGPYNFEFMDRVHREIVSKYQVDGIFANRWAPQGGDCYCVHCRPELQDATGRSCRERRCARSGAPPVPRVAQGAVDGAVEALGCDRARGEPAGAIHPERPAGFEDRRRAGGDSVHRQPGAARPDAAVGQRPARQGIPLGDGPAADRRHLQRRPRGAVPLEGLGAERAGDSALGRRGHRQRHAAVGDEVLRRAVRPPVAAGRRAHLRLALPPRALSAERGAARARGAAVLGADRRRITRASRRAIGPSDHVLGMYHALVEARVPFEFVHEAVSRGRPARSVQAPDSRRRRGALGRRNAAPSAPTSPAGGSLLATFASSLYDETGQRRDDFGLADVFGVSFDGRIDGPMQNSYLSLDPDAATGRRHPVLDGLGDTTRIINGVFRLDVRPDDGLSVAGDVDPDVSRPADGGRVSRACRTPTRASCICATSVRVESSTSRGTSIARSGKSCASDHGRLLAQRGRWATNEPAPVEVAGPGPARRHDLAAARAR